MVLSQRARSEFCIQTDTYERVMFGVRTHRTGKKLTRFKRWKAREHMDVQLSFKKGVNIKVSKPVNILTNDRKWWPSGAA
jgi:hypothetical protein